MVAAAEVISQGLKLFGIIDITEEPTASDIASGVKVLNNMLRNELADGASQFLIRTVRATLPAGISGEIYTFSIGTANASYAVQYDAVGLRQLWLNDQSLTVNRETRMAPKTDAVRTTYPGIITKWTPERQSDGSVLITAWQPPRSPAPALLEIGLRIPPLTAADGSDDIPMPPEGVHDLTLLYGRRVLAGYGKDPASVASTVADAERVNKQWRDWSHGQQWLRFVRS